MREAIRPGQVVKGPRLMARSKIDRMGLNTVPWRNAARSYFVWCVVMALCALCMWEIGSVVGRALGGESRIFHRSLVLLWWTLMMISPFITMLTLYFLNIATEYSSQSWLMNTRDPFFRLSMMWLDLAELEISDASDMLTKWVALMELPLDNLTVGTVFFLNVCRIISGKIE